MTGYYVKLRAASLIDAGRRDETRYARFQRSTAPHTLSGLQTSTHTGDHTHPLLCADACAEHQWKMGVPSGETAALICAKRQHGSQPAAARTRRGWIHTRRSISHVQFYSRLFRVGQVGAQLGILPAEKCSHQSLAHLPQWGQSIHITPLPTQLVFSAS